MAWNGRGELVCPLRGQSLESRLAAQASVRRARRRQRETDIMKPIVKLTWSVAVVLATTGATSSEIAGSKASVCVLPYPTGDQIRGRAMDGPPPAKQYSIRFNRGRSIQLSASQATLVVGFEKQVAHSVSIRGDAKPFASFRFRFEDVGSDQLCLHQSNLYQTWLLDPAARKWRSCRCEGAVEVAANE